MLNRYFKKARVVFFMLNLLSFATVSAQDSTISEKKPVYVQAALLYDLPQSLGLSAGVQVPFASVEKLKVYQNKTSRKQKDYFLAADVGFYRYPFNYTGVYFFPAAGVHVTKDKSAMYHEFAAGAGLLRTFYDGKVYEIDAAGNVKELSFFGRYYATVNLSYTLGYNFKKRGLKNVDVQIKPSLWFQFPYNSFVKPHISFEAGIRYRFSDITLRTKVRIKQKNS